jgi:hypothetical protein
MSLGATAVPSWIERADRLTSGVPLMMLSRRITGRSLSWSRCATSWRRLARQFELAFGMFWSAPLEAQLLAFLAMGHPRLFGIVRAEAASKEGC